MIQAPEYYAGTAEPVPAVLTAIEAARFLRLDAGRDQSAALRALRRLVESKRLRPCRIGRVNCYARDELLRFIIGRTEQQWEVED